MQYDKYFPGFPYFAIFSRAFKQVKYQQNMRNEENICHASPGCYTTPDCGITSLSLTL